MSIAWSMHFYQFLDTCPQISIIDTGLLSTFAANGFGISPCILSAPLHLHNTCGIICKAVFILSPYLIFFRDVSNQNETTMVMSSYGSASKPHAGLKQEITAVMGSSLSSWCPNIGADQLQKPKYSRGPDADSLFSLQHRYYSP